MPAHHLDEGDATVALGGRADALHAPGRHEHGGREARRHIVDHVLQVEPGSARTADVAVARRCVAGFAAPLVGLMAVVQPQVVVDGFGGQHGGEVVGQRLHAVERAVAADANEPFDVQTPQPLHDFADGPRILGVNVIARAADDRAAASHLQLGDGGE